MKYRQRPLLAQAADNSRCDLNWCTRRVAMQCSDIDVCPHVDTGIEQASTYMLTDERFHPRKESRRARQQSHLRTQTMPGRGHLYTHAAAADDGQSARHGVTVSGLTVGPWIRLGDTGYVG